MGSPQTQPRKLPAIPGGGAVSGTYITGRSDYRPEKLEVAQLWPQPRDKHEFKSFLELCTFYRRFNAGFTDIAKLLTLLNEQKQTYQRSLEANAIFRSLKEALCMAYILRYPWPG